MSAIQQLLTEQIGIWTGADAAKRSGRGRASSSAGSVYGIKKLRELILELAVRGKLVPQGANDEPASELLKRIQAAKEKLVKAGKIKKDKPLPPILEEEIPSELPPGWKLLRLGDVAFSQAGFAFKSNGFNEAGDGLPLIRIRDVGQVFTGTYFEGEYRDEFVVKEGDYLISMDGEFRVAKWLNKKALLNQRVSRLIFFGDELAKRFIAESLQARLRELQGVKAYTTVDHLSGGQITNSIIALPPVQEQHRIVVKVDELMALCDQLEAQHSNAAEAHEKIVNVLLQSLTQSADAAAFADNWQRIAAHFDTLFTTEASIDALKQTVLQLAAMGKLVPQNANDEPASELLKKIRAEKDQLIKVGKVRKGIKQQRISDDEEPFLLPQGWQWVRFGDAVINRDAERIPVSSDERQSMQGKYDYYGASGVIDKVDKYLFDKPLLLIGEDGANLINRSTPIAFIARGKYWVNNHAHVLDGINEEFLRFVELYINAIDLKPYVTGTAQPKMNQAKMNSIVLAMPPDAEQHRIVAKVDELMALCDQLKIRITAANRLQQKLADVVVEAAVA